MPRIKFGHTPEDDTQPEAEGHMPIKRTFEEDAEGEEDSSGHVAGYTPTPPPSAIGQHGQPTDPR